MSLISDLLARPAQLSAPSIYTVINGVFYFGNGATLLLWPGIAQTLFLEPPFVGHEAGLARVVGMLLLILGWLYIFGGRAASRPFIAAGVIDRVFLVPIVLFPVALSGTFPHLLLIFAVLDPILGLGAWWLLSKR